MSAESAPAASPPRPRSAVERAAAWVTFTCGLLLALVFVTRGVSAWQAAHQAPGVAVTSGYEEESWYAIWRAAAGQPVFFDATQPPYSAAYFNWLFYAVYRVPALAAEGEGRGVALITGGRLLTTAAGLGGVAVLSWVLSQLKPRTAGTGTVIAMVVFTGPLVGWWAHTVRPDVAALALETLAVAIILMGFRTRPRAGIVFAAGLFFAAWSFKQTYVFGLGASVIFLLVRRRWSDAAVLASIQLGLWAATLVWLGPDYRHALVGGARHSEYYLALGGQNLRDFLMKSLPLWVLAAAALPARRIPTHEPLTRVQADARLLGAIGVAVTLPLAFAASCKLGAASYYYFTTLVMLALLATSGLAARDRPALRLGAFTLAAVAQVILLGGFGGRISLVPAATELARTWDVWRNQPEPRFSHLTAFNLPWLNRASPPLVLAFNYPAQRATGQAFDGGGVGGLITEGKFRSLLLPSSTGATYDGAALTGFLRGETQGDFTLFQAIPSSP